MFFIKKNVDMEKEFKDWNDVGNCYSKGEGNNFISINKVSRKINCDNMDVLLKLIKKDLVSQV